MTVEKIAWIVGVRLGTMHESEAEWGKKIKGTIRIRRIYRARQLVYLVLYENLGVSYKEIGLMVNRPYESVVYRGICGARKWIAASKKNEKIWNTISDDVQRAIAAEQEAHALRSGLKLGQSS